VNDLDIFKNKENQVKNLLNKADLDAQHAAR
jgi:hypothetical protein